MSEPALRWIVTEDGTSLSTVLERLGQKELAALQEGRVFVDGRRSQNAAEPVRAGACVEVFGERKTEDGVRVLAENAGLIAAYKPAALATEPDRQGSERTARSEVAALLLVPEAQLHALSRLDVGVSGVVLFASSRAARKHALTLRNAYRRRYVAIAKAVPNPDRGLWDSAIERGNSGPRQARTRYASVARASGSVQGQTLAFGESSCASLLALEPETGRTHQLRLHAARAGAALLGDRLHGAAVRFVSSDGSIHEIGRIALHAAWLTLPDARGRLWRVEAELPDELTRLWAVLGGAPSDWQRALDDSALGDVGRLAR